MSSSSARSSTARRPSTRLPDSILQLIVGVGLTVGIVVVIVIYLALYPEKAERVAGWIVSGLARVWRGLHKKAIALKVQGEINELRANFLRDAPAYLIEKKLRVKWTTAEQAEAAIRGGDVVVFMKDAKRHDENLANAVMAYLPKALIPRARRYIERDTMRAIDLTVAKSLLAHDDASDGALDAFYNAHFDPAREGSLRVRQKISELDRVDMHGWLSRILLAEYHRLGQRLHPGEADESCIDEAEKLATWLAELAAQPPGSSDGSLTFRGKHFQVAVVFVAVKTRLLAEGVNPYRKRTKRHLYGDKFDSVYLIARDANIEAVHELLDTLGEDAMVASKVEHVFKLRADFKERVLHRERSICVCLRRRQLGYEEPDEITEDALDLPDVAFEVDAVEAGDEAAASAPRADAA
jgi:hypothetical protein